MERDSSLVVKHLITPATDRTNELHSSNPIVGNQHFLDHSLAIVPAYKLPRCGHLPWEEGEVNEPVHLPQGSPVCEGSGCGMRHGWFIRASGKTHI